MLHIILLAFLIAFIFGWNNSSLFKGGLTGSGLLSYKRSLALTSLGLIFGALMEGSKMGRTFVGFLTENTTTMALLVVLITSLLLMLAFTLLHIPVSLSHVSVGAYVGANFAIGLSLNLVNLELIVLSWLLVPAFSALITISIYKFMARIAPRFNLLTLDAFNRSSAIVVTLYLTYALGANNIGLINALYMPFIDDFILLKFMIIIMAMSVALGIIMLGKRITKTVGEDLIVLSPISVLTSMFSSALLMWFFTQFSIPISLTQAVIGGIFGAALIKRHVIFNRIVLYEIIGSWAAIITISFVLSMLIMKAIT